MSQSDTGELTLNALRTNGIDVVLVDELADLDTIDDVETVRSTCSPTSRLARSTHAAGV
jgi:glycosyltransferase A (GT-A) superfamily protein (DUF2064 family)